MQLQTNGRMCASRLKDHSSQIGKLSFISASTKTITLIVENSPVYQCLLADTNVSSYTSVANGCVLFLFRSSFFLKLGGSRLTYWDLDVSSFFLSFFLTICFFFFFMLDSIFTKLGQKHVWVDGYKTYGSKTSPGVIWGHRDQKR